MVDSIEESQVPEQGHALCSMKAPLGQMCCWSCSLGIPWGPVIVSELELARMGASQGFPRAAVPMGVFSRGTTSILGSLSCGAREARSACAAT